MSLEGPRFPQLQYTRAEVDSPKSPADDTLQKALDLARQLEELLEETRSVGVPSTVEDARAHSTRMARAFAASLVDELAALVRPVRHTGSS
jgi:hypothetical protein